MQNGRRLLIGGTSILSSLVALLGVGTLGLVAYFSPWTYRWSQARRLRSQLGRKRVLTLTYDDGPNLGMTPRLLDLLNAFDVNATFFMLGQHVERCPQMVERVLAAGHDIGCHADRHLNAWIVPPWRAVADIEAGYRKMERWLPRDGMFRPPYGKLTLPTWLCLRLRRAPVWWWTVDSGDTWEVPPQPQEIVNQIIDEGGGIVLMHDLDGSEDRKEFVLKTSSLLLEAAQRGCFEIKPLSELAKLC
jgi:peptidoglycan/xylan/chitin deacetylase (PgdA/CDA1 family)